MSTPRAAGPLSHPLAKAAGTVLTIAALGWLALEVRSRWGAIDGSAFAPQTLMVAAFGAVLLGAAYALQAYNWRDLVRMTSGRSDLPTRPIVAAAMRAQIGKYLPGNIGHLAARHWWLSAQGVAHGALGRALLLEILVLLAAAGLVSFAAWLMTADGGSIAGIPLRLLGIAGLSASVLAVVLVRLRWPASAPILWRALLRATIWMALMAGIFVAILTSVQPVPLASAAGAAAAGWAVGYATPGSPGGIGTREAAMGLLLGQSVSLDVLLPALALFRLTTVGADLLTWGAGRLVSRAGFEPATY